MDNRPIGRMIVAREDQELRLVDIALLAEHRNSGIGTRLIQELIAEAAKVGKPLRLQVLKSNPAARLYSRLGFLRMGDDDLYLQGDYDADSDVDLDDYRLYWDCMAGSDPDLAFPCSLHFDVDGDGTIDLKDFGAFQRTFGLPEN